MGGTPNIENFFKKGFFAVPPVPLYHLCVFFPVHHMLRAVYHVYHLIRTIPFCVVHHNQEVTL